MPRSTKTVRPIPENHTEIRRKVIERDGCCQYCGATLSVFFGTLDHMVPDKLGGKTSVEDCVAACPKCNGDKGDLLPLEFIARRAGFRIPNSVRSR